MKKNTLEKMSEKIYLNVREPYSMFSIKTGEGWKPIAQKVINKIIECNNNLPDKSFIYINYIKEKFAGLRINVTYNNVPEEVKKDIENVIKEAQKEASETCEECGIKENVGLRMDGWYTIMCENCMRKFIENNPYYGKFGARWKRFSDGEIIQMTSSVEEQ